MLASSADRRPFERSHALYLLLLALFAAPFWGCDGSGGTETSDAHAHEDEGAAHHDDHGNEHDDHGDEHAEGGVVALGPEAIGRIGLETAVAREASVRGGLETTGTVGYDERLLAHVTPRLGGRLAQVRAELGDRVAEGAVLAVVDSVELGAARADYLRSLARSRVAATHHERERELFDEGIVSDQEVLEADAHAREAAADLRAAEEALELYGVSRAEIERLAREDGAGGGASLYPVRAPLSGTVVAKEAVRGELVEPARELFTLADLSRVWIWIDVTERHLRHVALGDEVAVRLDAYPGTELGGRLAYLGAEVDPESRTVRGRIDVANDGPVTLRPGMFARVRLAAAPGPADGAPAAEGAPSAVAVPEAALQRHEGGTVVFVALEPTAEDDGVRRFERRAVTVGAREGGMIQILAGLAPGEEVVTVGAFLLKSQASSDQLGGGHHH